MLFAFHSEIDFNQFSNIDGKALKTRQHVKILAKRLPATDEIEQLVTN